MFEPGGHQSHPRSSRLFTPASMADPVIIPASKETPTASAPKVELIAPEASVFGMVIGATPCPCRITDLRAWPKVTVPTVLEMVVLDPTRSPSPVLVKFHGNPKKKSLVVRRLLAKIVLKSDGGHPQEAGLSPSGSVRLTGLLPTYAYRLTSRPKNPIGSSLMNRWNLGL
jgi:hypothetical protein